MMNDRVISPTSFQPSPQQLAVYAAVENPRGGNLLVEAVAGSGKTTTLVAALRRMKGRSIALCAYNKAIATEIQGRVADLKHVRAGTFHSFGFSAWRRVAPDVKVDDKKTTTLATTLQIPEQFIKFSTTAVSLAKQRAIGVLTQMDDAAVWLNLVYHFDLVDLLSDGDLDASETEDLVTEGLVHAKKLLRASVEADRQVIDFDDMIYAPLIHNARVWQNDWVLIDEAQDTNPARRALAKKMLLPGGRLIAVGDRHQAIYGFTGADNDSLDIIQREFNCTRMPLTVTYRCPKAVVAQARQYVAHIEAAETAPEGRVEAMVAGSLMMATDLSPADAILCRNTKPLVELAYGFIRRGIACHVEGRDIGRGLMALAGKWKVRGLDALVTKLDKYQEKETARMLAKGQEQKAEALADRVDTLKVIISSLPPGSTVENLRSAIERLFSDTTTGEPSPSLTLSTVHKSKGREWERVFLFGKNLYMPSRYARQDWQVAQEINLIYVALTRAKSVLVDVYVEPPKKVMK